MDMKRLNSGYRGYLPGHDGSDEKAQARRSESFYGRLGSIVKDKDSETPATRRISFDQNSYLRRIVVRLSYDEDAYPGGLDIDMFALLYDNAGDFVDCIFYKHPEDASGSFSLNQKTNTLTIDLSTVPNSCHTIVLASAVYTPGMSITELEGGLIEISEGFVGPNFFSLPLQSIEISSDNSSGGAGLLFFSLSEFGGKWRCRNLLRFCKAELPSLMKLAKTEAWQIEEDFAVGNLQNLRTVDFAARTSEFLPPSSSIGDHTGGRKSIPFNTSKVDKLRTRLSGIEELEHEETNSRLAAVEEEQKGLTRRLSTIENKLDMLLDALKQ